MKTETARAQLELVAAALANAPGKQNLLEDIGWPRDVEEKFFAAKATRLPEVSYDLDRTAFDATNAELARVIASIDGDHAISVWLRRVVASVIDRNRLIAASGTRAFGELSREIYGSATSTFFGLSVRNVDLADHLTERLQVHGWDETADAEREPMDAEALKAELDARIARHRPSIKIDVVVDEKCASKAIAGMSRVRVRADATFLPWEAAGLFVHEVETHAFTARNGAEQRHAPFLKAGGPRSTPTQEGLAVFAELYDRSLASSRLSRLATRVKLVAMAEDGASFLDLYRALLERGAAPRDAYFDAARVCRGGLVEGGAPFTKDACYLAGLLHVYAFLAAFIRGGFRDEAELLVCGRIALDDIEAMIALREMGLLSRPKHRPRWLKRWDTLLPYFAFTSFMESVDLGRVQAHYKSVIELAASARPSRA
ncbi:MAG: DUF1704 domain-containing protein [Myxococcales bacterium]|nr:DUF1704 domain-containing protein [Myxococcales bacterium]